MSGSSNATGSQLEISSTRLDEIPSSQVLPNLEQLVRINSDGLPTLVGTDIVIHADLERSTLQLVSGAGSASEARGITCNLPPLFRFSRTHGPVMDLQVYNRPDVSAAVQECINKARSNNSHRPRLSDIIVNSAAMGATQAFGLGLIWNGVTIGLTRTWGDNKGNLKPAARALTRIISAGCFGILQPIIKEMFGSLIYACRGTASSSPAITPAGEERRISRRRAILMAVINNEVNGGLSVGLGLFTAFAAIKPDTPVEEVARITSGLGFGFLLHEFARQMGEHFGSQMGYYYRSSVGVRSASRILRTWGQQFWTHLKGRPQFASIVGDHFGKWVALATFPYVEDGLNTGFKILFDTSQLETLNRWQAGGRIFLVNFVFFFWAENVIRFFAWAGSAGQAAIDRRSGRTRH